MTKDELNFAVFCIEGIAERLAENGANIYQILRYKSNILNEYIIKHYDTLHTQGKEYIIDDILSLMSDEGILL